MAEGSGVKNISLGFIRRMPARRFLMCCLPCHASVLGLSVFLFVAQPLAQLQSRRQEEADRVSARESMLVLRERVNRARAELHRYAPDVQSHGSVVKDVLLNRLFDRATAMLNRFDIHVTTLNVGQQSHDPHTHVNEEIILMIDGNAEERIGDKKELAKPGDVIRLGSKVLHNITNVGNKPCQYYAIQWN